MSSELAAWIEDLASKDPTKRAAAAESIARLGTGARPAAVALVQTMGEADAPTREWCAAALEEIGPPSTTDIPELASLARNKLPDIAYWAITLLGRAEGDAAPAVPALAEALGKSAAMAVRERAAWALGKLGPTAKAGVPALRDAAASPETRLARLATAALQSIGA